MTHPDWAEAITIAARAGASTLQPAAAQPLPACLGRVLAHTVTAGRAIPHFDSSAMDGFAVSGPPPWQLEASTASGADAHAASGVRPLAAGWARPILTGGAVPAGTTSIVRCEHAEVMGADAAGQTVLRLRADAPATDLAPARNIRRAGRETRAGEVLLEGGRVLSPADLAYAAVAGLDALPVRRRPRVALLMTGDEVITAGQPAPGQVRDTFGPALPGLVAGLGGDVIDVRRIGDDAQETRVALYEALAAAHVVLTTGGTGHSDADHVRRESARLASELLFPELAMRPGHPTTFAQLGGHPGAWHVGLPGNPLAAMTAMRVVVEPLLCGMLGLPLRPARSVEVAVEVRPVRVSTLMPARQREGNRWEPCDARGANMLRGLTEADGFLTVPTAGLRAGEQAQVLDLPWPQG
ncbi:molybdopterin molybdotransferase MoeA [Brevibacterium luteolum]|uniref:molybdopterin molybdotransferase MoeA n=1 Tax=Brevibacterium luteolum TaxID=199591 RepID=UPI00223BFF3D|nr:molybdopterin molybdotransferase MoeA [Brevibacterium luteolum]MCT1873074.1 molybdopterin molybdotransferase MoeA [Brevibacterium luteolum]MCT1889396.1 molybdopterin molybdotransferase MoeA [Brevibacterium luteolum]MCT1892981.1 molybdopterin molybdotransferase MoeA [Brevibacterium luteolum]MCT1923816.1 molybdopterin molybdotransferase MoeA [Brevibacterium luteolum]